MAWRRKKASPYVKGGHVSFSPPPSVNPRFRSDFFPSVRFFSRCLLCGSSLPIYELIVCEEDTRGLACRSATVAFSPRTVSVTFVRGGRHVFVVRACVRRALLRKSTRSPMEARFAHHLCELKKNSDSPHNTTVWPRSLEWAFWAYCVWKCVVVCGRLRPITRVLSPRLKLSYKLIYTREKSHLKNPYCSLQHEHLHN